MADLLTGLRALLALLLVAVLGAQRLDLAAAVLSAAWITDFFDGKSARRADHPTHLGKWDIYVDTLVGAAVLVGLAYGGYVSWLTSLSLVVVLGGGWILIGNDALSSALQAIGYAWLMWLLYRQGVSDWWLPPLTAVSAAVLNWRKVVTYSVPGFLQGVADLFRSAAAALRHREA